MTYRRTLGEDESKQLLAPLGARFPRETVVDSAVAAVSAAESIGLPVVVKLIGPKLAHKSERGLVRLGLTSATAVRDAAEWLLAQRTAADGDVRLLVAQQCRATVS